MRQRTCWWLAEGPTASWSGRSGAGKSGWDGAFSKELSRWDMMWAQANAHLPLVPDPGGLPSTSGPCPGVRDFLRGQGLFGSGGGPWKGKGDIKREVEGGRGKVCWAIAGAAGTERMGRPKAVPADRVRDRRSPNHPNPDPT